MGCSLRSPLCSLRSPLHVRCSLRSPLHVRCSLRSPLHVRCSLRSPLHVRCSRRCTNEARVCTHSTLKPRPIASTMAHKSTVTAEAGSGNTQNTNGIVICQRPQSTPSWLRILLCELLQQFNSQGYTLHKQLITNPMYYFMSLEIGQLLYIGNKCGNSM